MRALVLLLSLALAGFSAGCEPAPIATPTQVTVRVTSSDSALLSMTTLLNVRASLHLTADTWRTPVKKSIPTAGLPWPIEIPILPRNDGEASGEFEVVVEALQNDRVLTEARAVTSFVPNSRRAILELRLFSCARPDPICSPGCVGTACTVCGPSGNCEPVMRLDPNSLPQIPIEEPGLDSGSPEAGATTGVVDSGVTGVSNPAAEGGSMMSSPEAGVSNQGVDSAVPPSPGPECSATTPCTAGFTCNANQCVSMCASTRCDANATCSLSAGAPICTCNTGYVATSGSGTAVVCQRDLACDQLGCDVNAGCQVGSDSLRMCVCNNGYTGNGKTCTPVSCPTLTIAFGTVVASGGTTFGKMATYQCNTGYRLGGGTATRTCGADMQWSGSAPTCTIVDCGLPPSPSTNSTLNALQTTYGAEARYACAPGFYTSSTTLLTCGSDGHWNGTAPTCVSLCGNSRNDVGEACDLSASGTSPWTCSSTCTLLTMYTYCSTSNPCNSGESCVQGACSRTCTGFSDCPNTPPGNAVRYCSDSKVCLAYGCATQQDCAPGLKCYLSSGGGSFCTSCASGTAGGTCL